MKHTIKYLVWIFLVLSSYNSYAQFVVTNMNDSGPGSLRQAIISANASAAKETITFNISGAGPWQIDLQSTIIVDNANNVGMIIDGLTQPTSVFGTNNMVVLDGTAFAGTSLSIAEPNVEIYGLHITNFTDGLTSTTGSTGLIIGAAGRGNVISGNSEEGININGSTNALIQGNRIGTTADGLAANGNQAYGIQARFADNILIGGNRLAGEGNLISGNGTSNHYAIHLRDGTDAQVFGNLIGTDANGNNNLGNRGGINVTSNCDNPTIGGSGAGQTNVIAGCSGNPAILVSASAGPANQNVVIENNIVGLNATGTTAIPNAGQGIWLVSVNGVSTGDIIRGNTVAASGAAIQVTSFSQTNIIIENNKIGTDINGNGGAAFSINSTGMTLSNVIGIDNSANRVQILDNVIANSALNGLSIHSLDNALIQRNYIGVEQDGITPGPNTGAGIITGSGATNLEIGGIGNENIIAYNTGDGINFLSLAQTTSGTIIEVNSYFCNGDEAIDFTLVPTVDPPVIIGVTNTDVDGNSTASVGSVVDVYTIDAGCADNQGANYVGQATVAAGGLWNFSGVIDDTQTYVATVTDATNGISEFSTSFTPPPNAPTNLFIIEVSPSQIDLIWDDNSSDETDFIIERATDYNFTQNLQAFNFGSANGSATASFSNTTLLALETAYLYRVKAINGSGDSGYTNLKAGTTITAPGNALDFDGTNDYVELPDPSVFDFGTGDFTVEAYINGRNVGGGSQAIVGDFGTDDTNALTFWIAGSTVRGAVGGPSPHLSTPAILTNNTWFHVAFVREGDQARIYVDGVEQASTTGLAAQSIGSPDNMTIGRQVGGSPFYFNGLIDEVRFWNFARSSPQIISDLQIPVSGSEAGLVAYYQFDQGTAGGNNTSPAVDLLPDRSLNHNHGTLNGFGLNGATSNWVVSTVPPPPPLPFITTWKTDNPGTSAPNQITIPTNGVSVYNYNVVWGDGMSDTGVTGDITHTYAAPGTYTVSISGTFPAIRFNNGGDREKILTVQQWGDNMWGSMQDAFYGCTNLTVPAPDAPDLLLCVSMAQMFREATSFNAPIGTWIITGNNNSLRSMFQGATSFNQDISAWDVSGIIDMSFMFTDATSFNQPLNWVNTSLVENMSGMFRGAINFNQNLSGWDVSKVIRMQLMFQFATSFNGNIDNWVTDDVEFMNGMFSGATSFNRDIGLWNVIKVTTMNSMFSSATSFNQDISNWNVDAVVNMGSMFFNSTAFNQPIGDWDISVTQNMNSMFFGATAFARDLSSWQVGTVTDMDNMFRNAILFNANIEDWDVSLVSSMAGMFQGATSFDQDISTGIGWDVGGVANMSSMFEGATAFNQDIGNWDVTNVTSMSSMFNGASSFNQQLGSWNISNVATMSSMLNNTALSTANYDATLIGWQALPSLQSGVPLGANGLTYCAGESARAALIAANLWVISGDSKNCPSLPFITTWSTTDTQITIPTTGGGYNYDAVWTNLTNSGIGDGSTTGETGNFTITGLTNGDTYQVEISGNFPRIFFDSGTETDKILTVEQWGDIPWTSMNSAFNGCTNLTIAAVDAPNLSSVIDMSRMFLGATSLNQSLNTWNVSSVMNMEELFKDATSFNASISNWNVGAVTNMIRMFESATDFNQPLPWNTINVREMDAMFSLATSFNQDIGTWNVGMVDDMNNMFAGAISFNQDIGSWDVGNVTDMRTMFFDADNFDQDIGGWDVSGVLNMREMFLDASLFNQDLSSWDVSAVSEMRNMFEFAGSFNQSLGAWDISSVSFMSGMLNNTNLSTANYDATIIGWASLDAGETIIPSSITLGASNLTYCLGEAARAALIAANSWLITGDSKNCVSEIAIFEGPSTGGTPISAGQLPSFNFGSSPQGTNLTMQFTIENQGGADLNISSITITGTAYSLPSTPPTTITSGNFEIIEVILDATSIGTFNETVTITSDDADESIFDFPISGSIITATCTNPPTVSSGPDLVYCAGSSVTITGAIGGGATTATWTSNGTGTFNDNTLLNAIYTPSTSDESSGSTTLILTVAAAGACPQVEDQLTISLAQPITAASPTIVANVQQAFIVDVVGTSTINLGDDIIVTITQDAAKGVTTISQNNTIFYTANNGATGADSFQYEICNQCGLCSIGTVAINIADNIAVGQITVHNGISPNGDGNNDFFSIGNIQNAEPLNKVFIYNRWGDVVFDIENYDNTNPDKRFNGISSKGDELSSGVYFYKVEFMSGREALTGYLSLKK